VAAHQQSCGLTEDPMQYHDTVERSTDLLRRALPMMSRQAAALHPISYAVWYAYVADPMSALHVALAAHLAAHGVLDEAATEALYRRHLAGPDSTVAALVDDGMQRLLDGIAVSAEQANDQTARYGHSLQRLSATLGSGSSHRSPTRPEMLQDVLAHTLQMQDAMARLQQQLSDSQREIDGLRDEVRRVRQESLVDALTGLANRRAFDRQMALALATGASAAVAHDAGTALSLVTLDIDHFKRVNDSYGHAFGDQVLRAVAQVLQALTPDGGLAARVGGEEFALLLPAHPAAQASALAEKLRATVAASRIRRKGADAQAERITVSLGVALHGGPGEAAAGFIERADRALYAAKQAGRDRVVVAA
jgi:diguanylate cyclase